MAQPRAPQRRQSRQVTCFEKPSRVKADSSEGTVALREQNVLSVSTCALRHHSLSVNVRRQPAAPCRAPSAVSPSPQLPRSAPTALGPGAARRLKPDVGNTFTPAAFSRISSNQQLAYSASISTYRVTALRNVSISPLSSRP
eukprot:6082622-Pleurochrysis_carterae.AAC.3